MPVPTSPFVVVGSVFQTPTPHELQSLTDVAVAVDAAGVITGVHPVDSVPGAAAIEGATNVVRLSANQRLLPGLIDTHVHAPQWPQLGTGLDLPLEQWLFENTFPLESRYADGEFAQRVWDDMVPNLVAHGTTTAVYYSSIHEEATQRLAATCARVGQRAFVGRVAMDHPEGTPSWYRDVDADAAVAASKRSIDTIEQAHGRGGVVRPIITPRFAPACTDELLSRLGRLAAETGVLVQTHCSESDWEHRYAFERFGTSDTEALPRFGLIRRGTVLAHSVHVSDSDLAVIGGAGAGLSHCPLSNSYFADAVLPVARALQRGVHVGLGTDIAGGCHQGLLPQCVHAVTVSRMLDKGVDPALGPDARGVSGSAIDTVTAFHLATRGGAELLGVPCGLLEVGRSFDAFVVELDRPGSSLRVWPELDDEARVFEKIVRLAGPENIGTVWVAGRAVKD